MSGSDFFFALQDETDFDKAPEEDLKGIGRKVFKWVDQDADFPIRPQVCEEYVMRGSYHILADRYPPVVWWHPKFVQKLEELLVMA